MRPTTDLDPRIIVQKVPLEMLIEAYLGEHSGPFDMRIDDEDRILFICPACGDRRGTGGTAETIDAWRFRCWKCRAVYTRMMLERLVVERDECLTMLFRLINETGFAW